MVATMKEYAVRLAVSFIVPVCDRCSGLLLCAMFVGMCCFGLAQNSGLIATASSARDHFVSARVFSLGVGIG